MSRKLCSTCLLAYVVLGVRAEAQSVRDQPSAPTASATAANEVNSPELARTKQLIVTLTNQFRKEQGRDNLRANPKLTKAAQGFADFLAKNNQLSHTADGKQPWDRTVNTGYESCIVAENIAYEFNSTGFTTRGLATALLDGCKKSPGHRKNLLDPDVTEIGVAVAYSKDTGRYYAVQDFGRPKSEEITFCIANETGMAVQYAIDGKDYTVEPHYAVTQRQCRPPALLVHLPGQGKARTYHPRTGEHYVIRLSAGRYQITEE